MAPPELSIYLHYPFCLAKCPYCDFASVGREEAESSLAGRYFGALEEELALRLADTLQLSGRELASVYFGGRTPSLAAPEEIASLLDAVRKEFVVSSETEITLEANPGAVDAKKLSAFRATGVNRLSVGVQSFSDRELKALGRRHSAREARETLAAAREAGFENVGADLIAAVPGQSLSDFERNVEELLAFSPEHVSVYGLTLHEGTEFHDRFQRGDLALPDDETQGEMLLAARRRLREAGYVHYEISNHARPGMESRHNRLYWNGGDWLGIGVAAHSSLAGRRNENPASVSEWLQTIESGRLAARPEEEPSPQAALGEAVMLGLRQNTGVSLQDLSSRFGKEAAQQAERIFAPLVLAGFVREDGPRRILSERGFLVADSVMAEFF